MLRTLARGRTISAEHWISDPELKLMLRVHRLTLQAFQGRGWIEPRKDGSFQITEAGKSAWKTIKPPREG